MEYDEDFQSGEIIAYRVRKPADDLLRMAIEALRDFAKQRLTIEMDDEQVQRASFEDAYDTFIESSRAVLALYDKAVKR